MKQIILLDTVQNQGGFNRVRAVLWFPVPAGKRVPRPDITKSEWDGADQATEVEALRTGALVEEVHVFVFPSSMPLSEIKTYLQRSWTDRKAALDAAPFKNQFSGAHWDSASGWSA